MRTFADNVPEYIVCSAILIKEIRNHITDLSFDNDNILYALKHLKPTNIETGIMLTGLRHDDCIFTGYLLVRTRYNISLEQFIEKFINDAEQGFLTSKNRFLNRVEAAEFIGNTPVTKQPTDLLISENLY